MTYHISADWSSVCKMKTSSVPYGIPVTSVLTVADQALANILGALYPRPCALLAENNLVLYAIDTLEERQALAATLLHWHIERYRQSDLSSGTRPLPERLFVVEQMPPKLSWIRAWTPELLIKLFLTKLCLTLCYDQEARELRYYNGKDMYPFFEVAKSISRTSIFVPQGFSCVMENVSSKRFPDSHLMFPFSGRLAIQLYRHKLSLYAVKSSEEIDTTTSMCHSR